MAVVKRFVLDGTTYDIEPTVIDSVPTEGSNNTVSSSGVKSYVDSNYVPLSATQAPVTGLTDILTPVNLLPNSDFSRSDYYVVNPLPTLNSNYNNFYTNDDQAMTIMYSSGGGYLTLSEVIASKNALRIKLNVVTNTSQGMLTIQTLFRYEAGNTYTFVCTLTDNNGYLPEKFTPNLVSGTTISRIYYDVIKTGDVYKMILIFSPDTSGNNLWIRLNNTNTGTTSASQYDFTISDAAIYDGEFKNPPINSSLDAKNSRQFMLSAANVLSNLRGTYYDLSGSSWTRLCALQKVKDSSYVYKGILSTKNGEYDLTLMYSTSQSGAAILTTAGTYGIYVIGTPRAAGDYITKFRIASGIGLDNVEHYYLEAYNKHSTQISASFIGFYTGGSNRRTTTITFNDSTDGNNDTLFGPEYGYISVSTRSYVNPA